MFVKVALVMSLLKICAGEDSVNHQPHSNQAISSQSFVRHDVPVSYKYSSVHIYSTPKPEQQRHDPLTPQHHQIRTQLPKEIQYAPIYGGQSDLHEFYSKLPRQNEAQRIPEGNILTAEKTNIEPKPQELQNPVHTSDHLTYIPGYNVELLQAVNRFPGHNAVYRSYPHMSSNNKINKVNYLKQYVLYQKPEEQYITPGHTVNESVPTKIAEHVEATLSPFVPKQYRAGLVGQQPKLYNAAHIATLKAAASPKALINIQELVPHPKAHRMLLNIARTYNIANNPLKAQHASLTLLKNIPAHAQEVIHIPRPADVEKNTRLLPIQNNPIHRFS